MVPKRHTIVQNQSNRYLIAPQLHVYDSLPTVLAPYVTYISQPNFHSKVINTDRHGFRLSMSKTSSVHRCVDSTNWRDHERHAIILGDSFTFGVGASTDTQTVASKLNKLTPFSFLNLGIRASNSTQQIISAIPFLGGAESVIFIAGINNLTAEIQSVGRNSLYGPLFGEVAIDRLTEHSIFELAAMCQSSLNNIPTRRLIAEVGKRLVKKLSRPQTLILDRPARTNLRPDDETDLNAFAQTAVDRYQRDILIIMHAIPRATQVLFAAQPFAGTHSKKLSQEEVDLFRITDALQNDNWLILKQVLARIWPRYVTLLGNMCSGLGINFVDLNTISFQNWSFVDRVHMTDFGNHQVAAFVASQVL